MTIYGFYFCHPFGVNWQKKLRIVIWIQHWLSLLLQYHYSVNQAIPGKIDKRSVILLPYSFVLEGYICSIFNKILL